MAGPSAGRELRPPSCALLPVRPPLPGAWALPGTLTGEAVIDVLLTVQAAEAGGTLAHVAALGVMAEPVVHAGLGDALVNVHCTPLT